MVRAKLFYRLKILFLVTGLLFLVSKFIYPQAVPFLDQFIDLFDTPNSYSGESGKVVAVKSTEDGLEFSAAGTGDITSVGDCTSGAALDGSSDGGTYIRLYDGDSHYAELNVGDVSSNYIVYLPTTTGTLIHTEVDGSITNELNIFTTDDANATTGTAITLSGGEGIDTSESADTITIVGEDASDTNKGIASFDATDFGNASGNITITDDGHAHTTTSISGLDISADTNLAVTAPVVLTGDTVSMPAATNAAAGHATAAHITAIEANTAKVTESTTVSSPLVLTTYDISIPQATTSVDGYVVQADWDSWTDHVADNTQAHSDYLLNNADDITTGDITISKTTPALRLVTPVGNDYHIYAGAEDYCILADEDTGWQAFRIEGNDQLYLVPDAGNVSIGGGLGFPNYKLYVNGTCSISGNVTLGDASGDTLTFNASTLSVPNNFNIDSNTLYVDATNNRVGIGTTTPSSALEVVGSSEFDAVYFDDFFQGTTDMANVVNTAVNGAFSATAISTPSSFTVDDTTGFLDKGFASMPDVKGSFYYGSKTATTFANIRWIKFQGNYARTVPDNTSVWQSCHFGITNINDNEIHPDQVMFLVDSDMGPFSVKKSGRVDLPYALIYGTQGIRGGGTAPNDDVSITSVYGDVSMAGAKTIITAAAGNEVAINEDSADVDFRVESDTSTGALFVQGSDGNVGIGVTDPDTKLEVFNAGNQLKLSFDGTDNAIFAVDTNGDLTITPSGGDVIADVTGALTGNADTVTNATLTTALTVDTGTVTLTGNVANTSVLTIGAGAVSVSGANTGDNTVATTGDSPTDFFGSGSSAYVTGGTDVAFADGGTGLSSWTQYLIPYAATTTSIGQIAIGTDGQVLTSGGAGVAPAFETVSAGDNIAALIVGTNGDYATITLAMAAVAAGGTILVDEGTYSEAVTFTQDNLTLRALGSAENTIITQVAATVVNFSTKSGCTLANFTVSLTAADGTTDYCITSTNDGADSAADTNTVENNIITWASSATGATYYVINITDGNCDFFNNKITMTQTDSSSTITSNRLIEWYTNAHTHHFYNNTLTLTSSTTSTGTSMGVSCGTNTGASTYYLFNNIIKADTAATTTANMRLVQDEGASVIYLIGNTIDGDASSTGNCTGYYAQGANSIVHLIGNFIDITTGDADGAWFTGSTATAYVTGNIVTGDSAYTAATTAYVHANNIKGKMIYGGGDDAVNALDAYFVTGFAIAVDSLNAQFDNATHGDGTTTMYIGNDTIAFSFTGRHYYQRGDTNLEVGELVSLRNGKIYRTTIKQDPTAVGIYWGVTNRKDSIGNILVEAKEIDEEYDEYDEIKKKWEKKIRKVMLHDTPVNAITKESVVANDYAYSVAVIGDSKEIREDIPLTGAWVCIDNGTIKAGDYLQSSNRAGYLEKQNTNAMMNYTIGKALEDISQNTQTAYIDLL